MLITEKNLKQIYIVGHYPPPVGGVSIHIKRMAMYLIQKKIDFVIIDIVNKRSNYQFVRTVNPKIVLFDLLRMPNSLVHFHMFSFKLIIVLFVLSFKHKTILTFHNQRFLDVLQSKGNFIFKIICYMLNKLDKIIVVNFNSLQAAQKLIRDKYKVSLIPAFIPPFQCQKINNVKINDFRSNHEFLLASNASQISFYNGFETYGLDMMIDLVNNLVNMGFDVGMILLIPETKNTQYCNELRNRVSEYGLEERILFIVEPIQGAGLWEISDLVIRATNTDGSSLTVLESLYLKTPVLASDCVERPEGTLLFKTRDIYDLTEKAKDVLLNHSKRKRELEKIEPYNCVHDLVNTYRDLGG